jgi:DHA2 family multidrug resistance protein-like MFS transporter
LAISDNSQRDGRKRSASGVARDGLEGPQRYWAVLTVALAVTLAVLDGAIANVALPTIAGDLHASPASSIWVVNAYQIVITVCLLPLASLGEIVEYRRIYRIGLVIFTLASLACSFSDSLLTLSVARAVQGLGAAGIMSVNTALVRYIWPTASLGRGIGINALIVAVSAALGPTVAAGILAVAHWQWLFLINVPVGVIALLGAGALPRSHRGGHQFDWISAILCALTFGLLIIGIDGVGHDQGLAVIVAAFVGTVLVGFALVWRQLSQLWPLLPVDLLRIPLFAMSVATSVCSFMAQMMAYVSLPFFLQIVLGRTEVETGLLMTPWPLMTAVVAPIAGRLADRYPAGILGGIGLTIFAAGLALLAIMSLHPATLDIVWRMSLCGIGFGLFQSPNNRAIVIAAPKERSGGASGMLGTARLLGQTIGTALVALFFSRFPENGTTISLLVGAVIAAIAAGVSCLRLLDKPAAGRRPS